MVRTAEHVLQNNDSDPTPFLGMSKTDAVEEEMLSYSQIEHGDNQSFGNSLALIREIMQLERQIWRQTMTSAMKKSIELKKSLDRHQDMLNLVGEEKNLNVYGTLRSYFNRIQEDGDNDGCNDIDSLADEELLDLLHVHVRSNACRHIMWVSLNDEVASLLKRSSKAKSHNIDEEKRNWTDNIKSILAIVNDKVMSSRTQGDELLLEELEHFRHEVLFALQVNVHIVLRKVISSYREEQNDGFNTNSTLLGGKAMSSLRLEKCNASATNEEFRFFRCC